MKKLSTMLLILLVIQVLFLVPAIAGGLSQDGGGTWRINTYPADQREFKHLTLNKVYHPERGVIYRRYVGDVDNSGCSRRFAEQKADAELQFTLLLSKVLEIVGHDTYIVSMAVSVCHPEWFVIYLHDGNYYASKEAYDKIAEVLKIK